MSLLPVLLLTLLTLVSSIASAAPARPIADKSQESSEKPPREKGIAFCFVMQRTPENWVSGEWREAQSFDPSSGARMFYYVFEGRDVGVLPFESAKIVVQPKNGTVVRGTMADGDPIYLYEPRPGFKGKDRIENLVDVGNEKIRVVYFVHVQSSPTENDAFDRTRYCPKSSWKLSKSQTGASASQQTAAADRSKAALLPVG